MGTKASKGVWTAVGAAAVLLCAAATAAEPVQLSVNPDNPLYRLDGFGGNYCFQLESPVTRYTLETLDVRWARTEMTLSEWAAGADGEPPERIAPEALRANDRPGGKLRAELLIGRELGRRAIPTVVSVWNPPEWLCERPGRGPWKHGRRIRRERWPEMLESIGSYLVYARDQYGYEPELFSFNEPDLGVMVRFTPAEHRDVIKALGAHLEGLGLKTKMLLGDVHKARGTISYVEPAAADPEAMRYVGAVSFHSWGGAAPEQYAAWAELARRIDRPLVVGELGVNPDWRRVRLDDYRYALSELRMYHELLRHARPQATMQWEFTGDYRIVREERAPDGQMRLAPTARYWFVRHWCNLSPTPAMVLESASDDAEVLITAMRSAEGDGEPAAYSFHVANLGPERRAVLSGLPAGLGPLRGVRSGREEAFRELAAVRPQQGRVELALPAGSLLTLTTLPPGQQ